MSLRTSSLATQGRGAPTHARAVAVATAPARTRTGRWRHWSLAAVLALALPGCTLLKLGDESRAFYASTVLVGRVECQAADCTGPIIVAALRRAGASMEVVHRAVLHEPGGYELIVPKGEYVIAAFGDNNANGRYDGGEPAGAYAAQAPVRAPEAGLVAALDLALTRGPAQPAAPLQGLYFGRPDDAAPGTQVGAIADLDAAPFAAANGSRGYWAPMDFFRETGGNIYFLEPYDPARIPVLFVHGAVGSAQDWRYFFDHLDRRRYQAWFFQYPSGAAVDSMAHLLYWKLFNLQLRHHFDQLYITAHSMGGLVVRDFLLNHGAQFPQIRLFVSLSTPWAGEDFADLGVKHSPAVVPSWRDMQPEGAFMQTLFARRLPPQVDYYLMFGHKGGYSLLRPNNDGAVTLGSQLRSAAQAEARMVYGFDEDHVSILSSPQVMAQYQAVLDTAGKPAGNTPLPGRLRVQLRYDGATDGPKGAPLLLLRPAGAEAPAQRATVLLPLSASDGGRELGPIPAGRYEASLLVAAFSSAPQGAPVQIESGRTAELGFRLVPQGTLSGYVGADSASAGSPAGSYRPPHPTVRIASITLRGPDVQRTLVPRTAGADDTLEHFARGEDHAHRSSFSFVGLPRGEYVLSILAEGYRPHTSRHLVVPGQPVPLAPIVLEPLP